jgi:tetratricopeptide (TPR) repeat protein
MRSSRIPLLSLAALLVLCFGAAASLDVWFQGWQGSRTQSADVMSVVLGDARRFFANSSFVKADAYFHSGYYPTIFDDNKAFETPHMAEDSGTVAGHNHGDEEAFMGKPLDWIDSFGRDFIPARHTHLDEGGAMQDLGDSSEVGEILPWLRLSAELDPNDVRTYTVAAYWLRQRMGKVYEAEEFLREGLRANPGSYEILFELGRVCAENHHDTARAKNLWEAALQNWLKQESGKAEPDKFLFIQITSRLAKLAEMEANYDQALAYMEMWETMSPDPHAVQKQIDELREKRASHKPEPIGSTSKGGKIR